MKFLRRCAVLMMASAAVAPLASGCADGAAWDITTALDANGDRPRKVFFTDTKEIYCVVKYQSSRKDLTMDFLVRRVRDENNNKIDELLGVADFVPGISRGTAGINLKHPTGTSGDGPYPVGTYRCEVYIDGLEPASAANAVPANKRNADPVQQIEFQVQYPVCPVTYPVPGAECAGWYKADSVCRGASAAVKCTCKTVWECQ